MNISHFSIRAPDDDHQSLIFATMANLNLLQEHSHWFIDGTFKVAPALFFQIFFIHALVDGSAYPLVYVMMSDKTEENYKRIFRKLKEIKPSLNPSNEGCVFREAQIIQRFALSLMFRPPLAEHHMKTGIKGLAWLYDRSTSIICTILKPESTKVIVPARGVKVISNPRTFVHEEMEKLLFVWLTEKRLAGDTVTQIIICEKVRVIYGDLVRQSPGSSTDEASEESFKASREYLVIIERGPAFTPS
ncbi:unnamed protein product [Soboliphyme baturini]|uniref:MULE domain-containing protein n=1 Tax=Soboliphyme baturini TaxID=241478 RepID=A0A183J9W9_9BILA|nr:unnamed protein product [Soboliphyme baturini]